MIQLRSTASPALVSTSSRVTPASRWLRVFGLSALGALGFGAGWVRAAEPAKPAAPAAAPTTCKAVSGGKCCDPAVTAHLTKDAVFSACGESDATFLGESGSKESCKYVFRVEGEKESETYVEVYSPAMKDVPDAPNDPFFTWKKVGKAFVAEKSKAKMAPGAAKMAPKDDATALWMPGKGFFVSVRASNKVCTPAQTKKLASSLK